MAAFSEQGIGAIVQMAKSAANGLLNTTLGWGVLVIVATGLAWTVARRLGRRPPRQRVKAEIAVLRRQLRAMDRKVRKHGVSRAPDETIWQFAERLDARGLADVAAWYRVYAQTRYANDDPRGLRSDPSLFRN